MFRVTKYKSDKGTVFQVEGRLIGPWVTEFERVWQGSPPAASSTTVRFDMNGLTYVDSAGKKFLAERYSEGHELVASGCLMKSILVEITDSPTSVRRCVPSEIVDRDYD